MNQNLLKCIPSIYIPVKNVKTSSDWWVNNFELEFAVPFEPESDQAILKIADGQWLHLVRTRGDQTTNFLSQKEGKEYEMHAFTFEVREVEKLYELLKNKEVVVGELELREGCGINFKFYDPDGNKFDVNENIYMHRSSEEIEKVKQELFATS